MSEQLIGTARERALVVPPIVQLYLDHAAVGCGHRVFVVLTVGRKWVRLFYLPTLTAFSLSRGDFHDGLANSSQERCPRPAAVKRHLRKTVAIFKRNGLAYSQKAVRQAYAATRVTGRAHHA